MEIWEVLGLLFAFLIILVIAFFVFFGPISFLISMIFSRRRHRKMIDNVRERASTTVDEYGRDPLTNMKTP